jgi:hypothetical protein
MEREWRCGKCGTHHGVERRAWSPLSYRQVRNVRSRPGADDAWIAEPKLRVTPVLGVAR